VCGFVGRGAVEGINNGSVCGKEDCDDVAAEITGDMEVVSDVWFATASVVEEEEEEEMPSVGLLETTDDVIDDERELIPIGTDVDVLPSEVVDLIGGGTVPRSEVRDEDISMESEDEGEERAGICCDEEE
jgi:hypothetical protein